MVKHFDHKGLRQLQNYFVTDEDVVETSHHCLITAT